MSLKKITVISSSVTKQAPDGRWQLSELVAIDERGEPIDKTLKTFEKGLPTNQLIEVDVTKNAEYDEYMVALPGNAKPGGGGGGGGGKGLGASVDLLRTQVESLQTRVTALETRMDKVTQQSPPAVPLAEPASAIGDAPDDDIPF